VLQKSEVKALNLDAEIARVEIVTDTLPAKGIKIAEHLVRFPEKVARTAAALMPNYMCEYLYELASMVSVPSPSLPHG
jgi:arginyl-tRNA synthetase